MHPVKVRWAIPEFQTHASHHLQSKFQHINSVFLNIWVATQTSIAKHSEWVMILRFPWQFSKVNQFEDKFIELHSGGTLRYNYSENTKSLSALRPNIRKNLSWEKAKRITLL